jgi:hypothetical protein
LPAACASTWTTADETTKLTKIRKATKLFDHQFFFVVFASFAFFVVYNGAVGDAELGNGR